jgi:hypothetical protein
MPVDTERTVPVLVHIDPKDWAEFKKIAGRRKASMRLRQLIRTEIRLQRAVARSHR